MKPEIALNSFARGIISERLFYLALEWVSKPLHDIFQHLLNIGIRYLEYCSWSLTPSYLQLDLLRKDDNKSETIKLTRNNQASNLRISTALIPAVRMACTLTPDFSSGTLPS
jgi:hypothetical protein